MKKSNILLFLTVPLVIIACGLVCLYLNNPFLYVFLFTSLPFWYLARQKQKKKALWFNIGAVLTILAIFEFVLMIIDYNEKKDEPEVKLENVYEYEKDDIVGWGPTKDTSYIARKIVDNKLIYEIRTTIDSNGLRITPPCIGPCEKAIVFFGCSFMYGEGINDEETIAYQTALLTDRQYQVYNFSFWGYGPHQMLSSIEHGRVSSIVKDKDVRFVIYLALYPEHIYRLCGHRDWNLHGPKYEFVNNEVKYVGHFDDNKYYFKYYSTLKKSLIIKNLLNYKRHIIEKEKDLFIAVVLKARKLIAEQYPNAEFHVFMWDTEYNVNYSKAENKFHENGIILHKINKVLPEYGKENWSIYFIDKQYEGHPNSMANRKVAEYIENNIINKP